MQHRTPRKTPSARDPPWHFAFVRMFYTVLRVCRVGRSVFPLAALSLSCHPLSGADKDAERAEWWSATAERVDAEVRRRDDLIGVLIRYPFFHTPQVVTPLPVAVSSGQSPAHSPG